MKKDKNYDLIKGIKDNDEAVITNFYENNLPKVKQYIYSNSGNDHDAKDIFQDALVIVYQKIKTNNLQIECSLSTYLFAVCKKLWQNRQRKQKKMLVNDDMSKLDSTLTENAINFIDSKEKVLIIQKYCLKLGEGCKEILLLFFSGYSIKEIAKTKGLTDGYTRKRKFECQKKLIEMVEKDPIFIELKDTSYNP